VNPASTPRPDDSAPIRADAPGAPAPGRERILAALAADPRTRLLHGHRFHVAEALPWLLAIAAYFLFETYLSLGIAVLIAVLFTLSLDLVIGYAGIATLGHATMYGFGAYTAGLVAVHLTREPLAGLLLAMLAGAAIAFVTGRLFLHLRGNTLIMLTLAVVVMLYEVANKATALTGGEDGLRGIAIDPLFGRYPFDIWGRTRYWYVLVVLFVLFLIARRIAHSSFGYALQGIRENDRRMSAIGSPVSWRLLVVYTIAGAIAGAAGGLLAQSNRFVGLDVFSISTTAGVLIMLVFGGTGRLYGALVGAAIYVMLHHFASAINPFHWMFAVGAVLILTVLFAPAGLFGLLEKLASSRRSPTR
jgi:branched-chain amino acid transport system permease protein